MRQLNIVAGSYDKCCSISSSHGIPSTEINPVFEESNLDSIRTGFTIMSDFVDADDVVIVRKALDYNPDFIYARDVTNFVRDLKVTVNSAFEVASVSPTSIDVARNIIRERLFKWMPKGKFEFSLGKLNGQFIIYSTNDWTAGVMALYKAH